MSDFSVLVLISACWVGIQVSIWGFGFFPLTFPLDIHNVDTKCSHFSYLFHTLKKRSSRKRMDGMLLLCINLFLTRDSFVLSSEASTQTQRSGAEFEKNKKRFVLCVFKSPHSPTNMIFKGQKSHTPRTS